MSITSINNKLIELTTLYDSLSEKCDDVYKEEIDAALMVLKETASVEYETWQYWTEERNQFIKLTQDNLKELEVEIKTLVGLRGSTLKSRLFSWIYVKGRESWNFEKVKGFLSAHKEPISGYMEVGTPTVSCRKNKEDKKI